MNKVWRLVAVGAALAATAWADGSGFWQQLAPEERRAAGIDQLTAEQRAALDQLAGRFARDGARRASEQAKAEVRDQARQEARAEVTQQVRAEVKAEVTREVKTAEAAQAVAQAGRPSPAMADLAVRSRLVGKCNGWSGATVFRLENGQVWVQTDRSDRYWMPAVESQEVVIRPSRLGGWKLYLGENGPWVRVRRL